MQRRTSTQRRETGGHSLMVALASSTKGLTADVGTNAFNAVGVWPW